MPLFQPDHRAYVLASRLVAVAGLLLFFALALGAAAAKGPTTDEPIHLTRGVLLAQAGDLSLQYEHGPLSHRLIGLLTRTEPNMPRVHELESWAAGDRTEIASEFLWRSGVAVERFLFLGRLPIVWVGVLLGAVLAFWASAATRVEWPGLKGRPALASLAAVMALYACSPNLLASAALATTDMTATVTYFAAVCAWWFYWRRPGLTRLALAGVLLGLALSAKLTGVLLLPVLLVLGYIQSRGRSAWRGPALAWLALLPVAALTLWSVYAFEWRPFPLATYLSSWRAVLSHVDSGHRSFFLGHVSSDGWWSYFPVALLIKTPLPYLLLLGAALVWVIRARRWQLAAFTLLPAVAILGAAAASRLNIGYRHVLPALPFFLVAIGAAAPWLWSRRAGRWALGIGVAWSLAAALWVHPHHLAYFNELIGGPSRGYRYLGDSNLDWGQDIRLLAAYADEAGAPLRYAYSGPADPATYGLPPSSLTGLDGGPAPGFTPANPPPGRYALSASYVQGVMSERDLFDWFRRRQPDGALGYSILTYTVDEAQSGQWIAFCAAPTPLLSPEAAAALLGVEDTRTVAFDCSQSWVFPAGGPGWYVLPRGREPWWIESHLREGSLTPVYEHRATERAPDYAVYHWTGEDAAAAFAFETEDAITTTGQPAPLPVDVGGLAALEGYRQDGSEWLTLWRVAAATAEPLSMQAHLLTAGEPLVADSLGYPADQWQPGDRFVQRFSFDSAPAGEALQTGLYNYATLEAFEPVLRLQGR